MEVIWAASILRKRCPQLRVRVVNVTDLMILAPHGLHPHGLNSNAFESMFTKDRWVHFNYVRLGCSLGSYLDINLFIYFLKHGYPIELKGLLFGRPQLDRISIEGYNEEGTTTTPFDVSQPRVYVLFYYSNSPHR